MNRTQAIELLGTTAEQFEKYLSQYRIEVHSHHLSGVEFFHRKDIEQLEIALIQKDGGTESADRKALQCIRRIAHEVSDGHYSILAFSTEYRGLYDTYSECFDFRDWVRVSPPFPTIEKLHENMIRNWQQHIVDSSALEKKNIYRIVEDYLNYE